MKRSFHDKYGPWALITGAARGIGRALANQLAERGLDLVLVDSRTEELQRAGRATGERYPVDIELIPIDLARPDRLDRIRAITDALEVGLLVSNAAAASVGPFFDQDIHVGLRQVAVNCSAPLALVHHFGSLMLERRRGGIILLSSLSALQGSPLVASYAATKAFNLVLGESLWGELQGSGVDAVALLPGPTATEGFWESKPRLGLVDRAMLIDPDTAAREAIEAIGRGPSRVPGIASRLSSLLMRHLPRRGAVEMLARSMRRLYPGR